MTISCLATMVKAQEYSLVWNEEVNGDGGGNFPGIFNINGVTALANGPRAMYIDWIRIYQRGDAGQSFSCPSASDAIEPEGGWQGIEAVMGDGLPVMGKKELRNGQILIRRGEKIYTIMGQIVE